MLSVIWVDWELQLPSPKVQILYFAAEYQMPPPSSAQLIGITAGSVMSWINWLMRSLLAT